jgi:nucleotide-binding universal stress UspA family protein
MENVMNKELKLLVAYDGSECSDAALDDLRVAGLPENVEATVLSITEIWLPPSSPSVNEIVEQARDVHVPADLKTVYIRASSAIEHSKEMALNACKRLQGMFPGWKLQAESTYGSPAWEIIKRADSLKPDLIVVGSHGRSALGRFFIGSVSQKVANEAHTSVRVARGRIHDPGDPVRVVVGVDGSQGSKIAVDSIRSRVWPAGTEIKVVAVEDPLFPTSIGYFVPPVEAWVNEVNTEDRSWIENVVDQTAKVLNSAGLKVVTEIKEGDPKHVLPDVAEKWGADTIFLGYTGFTNRFERMLLGSVSSAIVTRAHCSVEVARKAQ